MIKETIRIIFEKKGYVSSSSEGEETNPGGVWDNLNPANIVKGINSPFLASLAKTMMVVAIVIIVVMLMVSIGVYVASANKDEAKDLITQKFLLVVIIAFAVAFFDGIFIFAAKLW